MLVNAGDPGDVGLIPGLGISPGGGNDNPSNILAWKISRIEEPSRLQHVGLQSQTRLCDETHTQSLRKQEKGHLVPITVISLNFHLDVSVHQSSSSVAHLQEGFIPPQPKTFLRAPPASLATIPNSQILYHLSEMQSYQLF